MDLEIDQWRGDAISLPDRDQMVVEMLEDLLVEKKSKFRFKTIQGGDTLIIGTADEHGEIDIYDCQIMRHHSNQYGTKK